MPLRKQPILSRLPATRGGDIVAENVTGLEPNEPEESSNEPDTGADVHQEGEFQGEY